MGKYFIVPIRVIALEMSQVLAYLLFGYGFPGRVPIHFETGIHQSCESFVCHRMLQFRLKV